MVIQIYFKTAAYISASGAADSFQVVIKPNAFWKDIRGISFENEIILTREIMPQFQLGGDEERNAEIASFLGENLIYVNIGLLVFTSLV